MLMNQILNKLSIGLKLGGSFVLIILILGAVASLSYFDMGQLNRNIVSLYFDHTIPIQNLGEANAQLGLIKSNIQLYIQIPQPKNTSPGSQEAPRCGSCHIAEVAGLHYVGTAQTTLDATRCLGCHAAQAKDTQHGRSAADVAAGHSLNIDCAGCHPAQVTNLQHAKVEKAIYDDIARVNVIMAAYSKNPLLTSEEKTALTRFNNSWSSYQVLVADLLEKHKSGLAQETLHRVVVGDALASQTEIEDAINNLVAVNQRLADQYQKNSVQTFNTSTLRLLMAVLAGIALAAGLGFAITLNIRTPVNAMAMGLKNLGKGNLKWEIPQQVKETMIQRSDEMGVASQGFDNTVQYLQEMAGIAKQIASGDLTVNVNLRSEQDEFGIAFSQMVASLRTLITTINERSKKLSFSAEQVANISSRSSDATNQIAILIQRVAKGTSAQTEGVNKTASSVEQMSRAIDGVARGAQEQANAVTRVSQLASRISTTIEQVTSNAQSVTRDSAEAARYSRDGAKTVKETISGMEVIRAKVGISATRVEEMGTRSEEIGAIVETIEDIASQTNLLALNAAIEAARAEGTGKQTNERLAQNHLVGVAKMLAEMLGRGKMTLKSEDLAEIAHRLNVEVLSISDGDGVVIAGSQPDLIGFRFPENAQGQASAFRKLLNQKDGVVTQPILPREDNGKLYLFVGVSRLDQPGIIQAGTSAKDLLQSEDISRGFAVVADEVRKLAERSSLATKEIAGLIKGIQKSVKEAASAMHESANEVEAGVKRANSSGEVLNNIQESAESVYKQAEEAGSAAARVSLAADELVGAVDSVSAVIEENTAATEEMGANSTELTQAIESIASVSEESSAAVDEVSASTEQVSAQVEEVSASAASMMEMAKNLQQIVAQFKLS